MNVIEYLPQAFLETSETCNQPLVTRMAVQFRNHNKPLGFVMSRTMTSNVFLRVFFSEQRRSITPAVRDIIFRTVLLNKRCSNSCRMP